MKRYVLLAVALCFVVGMLSCGGGGGSKSYEFYGRWLFNKQLVSSNCTWTIYGGTYTINQNGEDINLRYAGGAVFPGGCSPSDGTFYVNGTATNGVRHSIQGGFNENDRDRMSGTWRMVGTNVGCWAEVVWTADLVGRGIDKSAIEQNNLDELIQD